MRTVYFDLARLHLLFQLFKKEGCVWEISYFFLFFLFFFFHFLIVFTFSFVHVES